MHSLPSPAQEITVLQQPDLPASSGLDAAALIDPVALAHLYGEPMFAMPRDLYIPPDALKVFLEAFARFL